MASSSLLTFISKLKGWWLWWGRTAGTLSNLSTHSDRDYRYVINLNIIFCCLCNKFQKLTPPIKYQIQIWGQEEEGEEERREGGKLLQMYNLVGYCFAECVGMLPMTNCVLWSYHKMHCDTSTKQLVCQIIISLMFSSALILTQYPRCELKCMKFSRLGWKLPVHVSLKLFFSLFGMGR